MFKVLQNLLIYYKKSILQAMEMININSKGILLVVDENDEFLGTLTDGDLRRALLSGFLLNESISKIYNRNCVCSNENINIHDVKTQFIENRIKLLPIIDKNKQIIDYFEIDDLIDFNKLEKENPVLIMAGGLGTRLSPLTDNLPKPGFKNILISVNYKADMIENYFRDGSDFGVSIKYIKEKKRLGTAGAKRIFR